MAVVIDIIREFSPWIYGACAIAALWYLRVVLVARRDRRYAVFALEREQALNRVYGAWGAAFGIILVMGVVYALEHRRLQGRRAAACRRPATRHPGLCRRCRRHADGDADPAEPDVTATPTATPKPGAAHAAAHQHARRRADRRAAPRPSRRCSGRAARPATRSSRSRASGKSSPARWPSSAPRAVDNFQFYKLEYGAGANPDVWSYFDGGEAPGGGRAAGHAERAAAGHLQHSRRRGRQERQLPAALPDHHHLPDKQSRLMTPDIRTSLEPRADVAGRDARCGRAGRRVSTSLPSCLA